jgi:asparagine synthase (glutamine-hydrolysing)
MTNPISRVINLISDDSQRLWSTDQSDARRRMLGGDADEVLGIDGTFALVAQEGERVVLARSLDRPMRYFLAKSTDGPVPFELHANGACTSRNDAAPNRMP